MQTLYSYILIYFDTNFSLGAGAHLGLTVVLDAKVDNYFCSSTSSVGFKVQILSYSTFWQYKIH